MATNLGVLGVIAVSLVCATAGCFTVRAAAMERPDEQRMAGPVTDYEVCRAAAIHQERADTKKNGRMQTISLIGLDGSEVCRARDTDENGRIDSWEVFDHGRVTQRGRDIDESGTVDEVTLWPDPKRPDCPVIFVDQNGDGKPDEVKFDICNISGKGPPNVSAVGR
jgi:hypothetical protein